jgi:Zn-dependent protease
VGEGWQLLKIRGIPLRIHPTWFIILGVATLAFEGSYRIALGSTVGPGLLWGVAFVTALLLFVSVLLHELGHSFVALAHGVKVRSITLFLMGGVASVEKECATPMGALLVAAAGPAVSLLLGFALIGSIHGASHLSPVLGALVTELGRLNLMLAFFNLLPGLPLDGGLILKALVWQVTGSQRRGVEVANASGRFLAYLAIGLGTVLLLRGSPGATWLILLGWFGLGAARSQTLMLQMQRALRELRVRDVAGRRFRVLEASTSLRRLSELRLEPGRATVATGGGPASGPANGPASEAEAEGPPDWLLVCDRGRWQGVIDDAPLQNLPVQRWDSERVGDHLLPLDTLPSISESAPLWQAALQLEETGSPRLLVLSPAGLPSGTLERPDLGQAVLERLGLRLPPKLLAMARRQNTYPSGLPLGQVSQAMVASGEVSSSSSDSGR